MMGYELEIADQFELGGRESLLNHLICSKINHSIMQTSFPFFATLCQLTSSVVNVQKSFGVDANVQLCPQGCVTRLR